MQAETNFALPITTAGSFNRLVKAERACMDVHLPVCMDVHLPVCMDVHLFVWMCACLLLLREARDLLKSYFVLRR